MGDKLNVSSIEVSTNFNVRTLGSSVAGLDQILTLAEDGNGHHLEKEECLPKAVVLTSVRNEGLAPERYQTTVERMSVAALAVSGDGLC